MTTKQDNKTIFIGGSISIESLDNRVTEALDNIMRQGWNIIVGDAHGVDCLIQIYCHSNNYKRVTIYASNGIVRNNIGDWEIKSIEIPHGIYGRAFYTQKDIAMTTDCDIAFMVWDGKSKGTLANIERAVMYGKRAYVYLTDEKKIKQYKTA